MDNFRESIAQMRERIAEQEREIAQLETEIAHLHGELAEFEARYNDIVKPMQTQLDAVKAAIKELEQRAREKAMGMTETYEDLLKHVRRPSNPPPRDESFQTPSFDQNTLGTEEDQLVKVLYRKLARRYHPDLATGEDDRERRTRLMSLINRAYAERDIATLKQLNDSTPDDDSIDETLEGLDTRMPLETLQLRQLEMRWLLLQAELEQLRAERHELMYGSMMELKLDAAIARSQGHDLLSELREDMEQEYWAHMKHLDHLREDIGLSDG